MRVAIIGGTGFVGGYLTDALLAAGHSVSQLVRHGSESKLRHPEQVLTVNGDIADNESIRRLLDGCDAVIYNVGILREVPRKGITFASTQYEGLVNTVDAALAVGVQRLLLMSANGVKIPGTQYQETKRRAEEYALRCCWDKLPSVHGAVAVPPARQSPRLLHRLDLLCIDVSGGASPYADNVIVILDRVHIMLRR